MILDSGNSIITDIGLNKIFEAKTVNNGKGWSGVYIDIAYWVPVLDTDDNMDTDKITPVGNVHWNNGLSTFAKYNSLYSGVVYNSILGDEVTSGSNGIEVKDRRSNFKIICENFEENDVHFNKIALYAVVRDEPGNIHGGPFFFGQVLLIKYDDGYYTLFGTNSSLPHNQFIVNYQLAFNENDVFSPVFYSNSADHWEKTTNHYDPINGENQYGITWDGSVFIGVPTSGDDITWWEDEVGELYESKYTITSYDNELSGQLGLQYIDDISETSDDDDIFPHRRRAIFNVDNCGDLEINIYGGCNNNDYYNILPKNDDMYFLGNAPDLKYADVDSSNSSNTPVGSTTYAVGTRRWSSLNLYRHLEIVGDDFRINISPLSENVFGTGSVNYGNTSVRVGPHYRYGDAPTSQYFYTHSNISNDIYSFNSIVRDYSLGIRSSQDIHVINIDTSRVPSLETGIGNNGYVNSLDVIVDKTHRMISINDVKQIATDTENVFHLLYSDDTPSSYIDSIDDADDMRYFIQNYTTDADVKLVSSNSIWSMGDFVPMVGSLNDLGSIDHSIQSLYIDTIGGDYININAHLYSDIAGTIGRHPINNKRWHIISSKYIGTGFGDDSIISGVFDTINGYQSIITNYIHVSDNDYSSNYDSVIDYGDSYFDDGLTICETEYQQILDITLAGTTNYTCIESTGFGLFGKDLILGKCGKEILEGHFDYIFADNVYLRDDDSGVYYIDMEVDSQFSIGSGIYNDDIGYDFNSVFVVKYKFVINIFGQLDKVYIKIANELNEPKYLLDNGKHKKCSTYFMLNTVPLPDIYEKFNTQYGFNIPRFDITNHPTITTTWWESKTPHLYSDPGSRVSHGDVTYTINDDDALSLSTTVCDWMLLSKNFMYTTNPDNVWHKIYDINEL